MLLLYDAVITTVAVVLLLDLLFGRWVDATVADLVIGLGGEASASLQTQLRRAMGDPSVVVGYWAPDVGRYVDDVGAPLRLPADPADPGGDLRRGQRRSAGRAGARPRGGPRSGVVDRGVGGGPVGGHECPAPGGRSATGRRRLAASRRRIVEAADRQRTGPGNRTRGRDGGPVGRGGPTTRRAGRRRRRRDRDELDERPGGAGRFRARCAAGRIDDRRSDRGIAPAGGSVAGAGRADRAGGSSPRRGGGLRLLRLRGGADQRHQARIGNPGRDRGQPAGRRRQGQHHR